MPAQTPAQRLTQTPAQSEVRDIALIHAPLDRVWALSTRVELVRETLGMELIGGTTRGFITESSRVVWRGWKFGLPTTHHTLITGFSPPPDALPTGDSSAHRKAWFQDSQELGRFAVFSHDHFLQELRSPRGPVTLLGDHVRFSLPWITGGAVTANLLMKPHVKGLVRRRFQMLKQLAEGEGWRRWCEPLHAV